MISFLLPLLILTSLSACTLTGQQPPAASRTEETIYHSNVILPDAKALYLFGRGRLLAADGDYQNAIAALLRATQFDPDAAYLRLALAEAYLDAGQEEEGRRQAEEALRLQPDFLDAELLLGNVFFRQEDDEQAIAHFLRALEIDPEEESAYLHLGIAYARQGDYEKGAAYLKTALERHPDAVGVALTLARLYREMGQNSLAKDLYQTLIDSSPEFLPAYSEFASLLEDNKKIESAIDVYRQLLALRPDSPGIRHHVARLLILNNRFDEALAELNTILDLAPDDLDALRKVGLIYFEQSKWDAAAEAFSAILKIRPDLHAIQFYLGLALERQGKWQDALEAFQQISADAEVYGDALPHQAYLLHQLGHGGAAVDLLQGQLATGGEFKPELFSYLATLYQENKQLDSALTAIEEGLTVHPEDIGLLYHRGLLYERRGERDKATAAMRQVLQADPGHPEALNYIAYGYAESGEHLQEALQLAKRAVHLKPEGHILDTLGWVYFKLDRLPEAGEALEKAVELLPDDPLVREHLGDVYRAAGDADKARGAYRKALELDPQAKGVREKLKGL